jgi:hypothetical protein
MWMEVAMANLNLSFRRLLGGTEETNEKPQSEWVSRPRFKPGTWTQAAAYLLGGS